MASEVVYATVTELRAQPNVQGDGDDTVIELALLVASRAIDGFCNRVNDGFVASEFPVAREYPGQGTPWLYLDEFIELPTVVEMKPDATSDTYSTTISPSSVIPFAGSYERPNYNSRPYSGLMLKPNATATRFVNGKLEAGAAWLGWFNESRPSTNIRDLAIFPTVRITARWGYSETIPPQVKQATITMASRWFKRGQSFWADVAGNNDMQMLMYRQSLDPDVKMMLQLSRMVRAIYAS